jgi:tetratricopeptide (TPR) repeat protein
VKVQSIVLTFFIAMGLSMSAFAANSVSVEASHIGDASHFEFAGRTEWKYDLKRDGNHVVLNLAGLDAGALSKLRAQKDSLVQSVKIDENGVDGAAQVTFAISNGSDFFDYITESPSRLIVDFFPRENAKKPAGDETKKVAAGGQVEGVPGAKGLGSVKDISAQITGLPQKAKRSPAASDAPLTNAAKDEKPSLAEEISSQKDFSHGIFDGGDPEFRRFTVKDYEINQDSIFKSRGNFYLPFPMLDLGNPQLKALMDAPPSYEIVPNDTKENKQARVVLSLFSGGTKQRALFLTTSAEFLKTYPQSQYDEIIRYMMADTRETMWREQGSTSDFETAMTSYQSLTEKYPQSPITPRTLLFIGYSYMDRGDSFGALKAFQRFSRLNPNSKYIDQVNVAVAEAYLRLNRYDDATKMLEQIEESAKTPKARQDASFRKGDVEFRRGNWDGALKAYRASIAKYPDAISRFPNAYYNIAEAEFTKGDYRGALEDYRLFLQRFPDHAHGGYAMTRMGELIGILGADAKRAQGAFMESFFRYRSTPGAGIARIRLLVSRFPEMKEKELKDAQKEITDITEKYAGRPAAERKPASEDAAAPAPEAKKEEAKKDEKSDGAKPATEVAEEPKKENASVKKPELPGIEEFTTLLLADGFNARKEYDHAAKYLIGYYQKNPITPNKDRIVQRIAKNVSEAIGASIDQNNFMDGLRRYSANTSGWLKNTDRVDVRYSVGRAYEQAGVFKESSDAYRDCLKRLAEIKGAGQEREHSVYEDLPRTDQLNLRLAVVAAKTKDFALSENYLKNIDGNLAPKEQIERAEISADVAEARGQSAAAKKYLTDLINTWKGDPELTSPLHLRIARLSGAAKNYKDADQHLAKVLEMKASEDVTAQALELRGDLMVARGNRNEAAKSYRQLLADFGDKRPLASVRYRLGQLLYEDGDLKGAEGAWSELKPAKDGMWAKLASEQMQGAKWQKEYKKYLNRIPAASELR